MRYESPVPSNEALCPNLPATPITADLPDDPSLRVEMERWMRLLVEVLDYRRTVRQLAVVADQLVLRYLRATVYWLGQTRRAGVVSR
jgi:hypothetical protein